MNATLHADLAGDRNMSWVPAGGWLTHLELRAQSPTVDYDMKVSPGGDIRLVSFAAPQRAHVDSGDPAYTPQPHVATSSLAALAGIVAVALAICAVVVAMRLRRRRSVANAEGADSQPQEH
jgi:hypothetical protein